MPYDRREIEAKFNLQTFEEIRRKLQAVDARLLTPRSFERNLRFDTPDRSLHASHQVLRLRLDSRVFLTYKQSHSPERRTEIEFEVVDAEAARLFLEALGFEVVFAYEKYRETFAYQNTLIALDELPFGRFVEVEGPSLERVEHTSKELNLAWDERVPQGYMEIFEQLRQRRSLPFQDATFESCKELEPVSRAELTRDDANRGREVS
jgi:adenylate cyclase class 2